MRKVEYWVAEDGQEFDSEKECYDYEHQYDALADKIILLKDEHTPMTRTTMFATDLETAYAIIVPDDETAVALMEFMNNEGMENPWDRWNGLEVVAGHYYYDDGHWCSAEEEISKAQKRFQNLRLARMRAMNI